MNENNLIKLRKEIQKAADPAKAKLLSGFFKTGKGEYGEGDIFLGIVVPVQRQIADKYRELPITDLKMLIKSEIHEERMIALFILIHKFNNGNEDLRKECFDFYLRNTGHINNWDLVDLSAHKIVGKYLENKNRSILNKLSKSKNLWERRIAVLSTFQFIKNNDFTDAIKIAEILLSDKHDLIHKAVGWMLREIGKREQKAEEEFLDKYSKIMPRTMLRYAIEKFDKKKKDLYLAK